VSVFTVVVGAAAVAGAAWVVFGTTDWIGVDASSCAPTEWIEKTRATLRPAAFRRDQTSAIDSRISALASEIDHAKKELSQPLNDLQLAQAKSAQLRAEADRTLEPVMAELAIKAEMRYEADPSLRPTPERLIANEAAASAKKYAEDAEAAAAASEYQRALERSIPGDTAKIEAWRICRAKVAGG
jgi:hypothetical protein